MKPICTKVLTERLTFNRLYGFMDKGRADRATNVKGPSLRIEAFHGGERYHFNFTSAERTEGCRHKGYIQFYPPRGRNVPLQNLECSVDCTCKDYRYRWAWANKQRGSGKVGPDTYNKSLNRSPRITNPTNQPGLCKHIGALKKYITGLYTTFESDLPDDGRYLDRMVRAANRQTISSEGRPVSPPRADQAVQQVTRAASPSDIWTSAGRGAQPSAPATPTPPAPPRRTSIVRPGQPHPNATPPVPQELPPPATPRQRDRAGRRRESLDLVVMDMKPVEQDLQILLHEAEEAAALTPPPAPAASASGGEDLVSLVRSIRDMIAKLVGEEAEAAPEAPAPAPEDQPAIPEDAERVGSTT